MRGGLFLTATLLLLSCLFLVLRGKGILGMENYAFRMILHSSFFAEFSVLLSGRCDRCAGRERRTEKWPADFYQEKQGEGTSVPARGRGTPVPDPVMEKRRKSLTKSLLLHIL